jgi:hypothetical protein
MCGDGNLVVKRLCFLLGVAVPEVREEKGEGSAAQRR